MRDFFISYTKADRRDAVWIADTLERHGYTVYMQAHDTSYEASFASWMTDTIQDAKIFIAVWSKDYAKSKYCQEAAEAGYTCKANNEIEKFILVCIDTSRVKPQFERNHRNRLNFYNLDGAEKTRRLWKAVGYSGKVKLEPERVEPSPEDSPQKKGPSRQDASKGARYSSVIFRCLPFILAAAVVFLAVKAGALSSFRQMLNGGDSGDHAAIAEADESTVDDEGVSAQENDSELDGEALNRKGSRFFLQEDYDKALMYYEQAVEKGNAAAMKNLGFLYEYGNGVPQDYETALRFYQMSRDNGYQYVADDIARLQEKMNSP